MISQIATAISEYLGKPFIPTHSQNVQGGCINQALKLTDGQHCYFIKLNSALLLSMFEAEKTGLEEIIKSGTIQVPTPLFTGVIENYAYLVLEYIEFKTAKANSYRKAGMALAKMHQTTQSSFGWSFDNTIGSTLQQNTLKKDWIQFWQQNRLEYQLNLAKQKNAHQLLDYGTQLLEKLPLLLNHQVVPSLLHGDLWGGNMDFDQQGRAVIYDPAVYYGDRETDIAMTRLFGGFNTDFYSAYNEVYPLEMGYQTREILYNLYHILNHYHLFGGGYGIQAENMIKKLLSLI